MKNTYSFEANAVGSSTTTYKTHLDDGRTVYVAVDSADQALKSVSVERDPTKPRYVFGRAAKRREGACTHYWRGASFKKWEKIFSEAKLAGRVA